MFNCKSLLVIVLLTIVTILAPACNTMRGVGKDIQRAGEKIQEWTR